MFAKRENSNTHARWTLLHGLLLVVLLLAFLATIDGPVTNFGSNGTAIANSRTHGSLGWEHGIEPAPAVIAIVKKEPSVPPAFFFLFDCKQNLRLWPVVAGDISRSPPLFFS
jgi:hypothetical protein